MKDLTAYDLFEYRGWVIPGPLDFAFVALSIGFLFWIIA